VSAAFVQSMFATGVVSLIALVGIVFVYARTWSERVEVVLISFAAGVLLSTAFLDLLPEAVAQAKPGAPIFAAALAAMIVFFLLERLLHGFHGHEEHHAAASRYLILIGDGLHNFIDGVAIAVSFIAGPEVGVTATLAVAVHEIPQELADYAILIRGGFTPRRALALNFVTGLSALVGVAAVFALQGFVESHISWFMTATAGMFVYIAASDLLPELHHSRLGGPVMYLVPFLAGVATVALLGTATAH
jgi:zinc and cadmium transporter